MKIYTAVLHIKNRAPQSVAALGGRVDTSMTAHQEEFPDSDPPMEEFGKEVEQLDTLIKEKDGSKIKNQAILDQTNVVYAMLKLRLNYVNKVAKGDKAIILLSGFECNNDPVSRDVPEKALIRRIEDGSVLSSAKIYMDPLPNADRYKVETAASLTEPINWRSVLDYGSLNKLGIGGLARRQEIHIRVTGGNRHGWGLSSEPMVFFPR